ncbi:DUF3043 domain-containing protein [Brachybacterium sp. YJGR34]|uniref:DUF3043 domain-containing protein n=1 Tax=Brachybacterium sp. YJGR34 TaxID=2059911 RepID=UPI000E0C7C05|nr:DUF3043 domain-containing protein [Brachybacterium sp. YJGR34]
MIFRKSETPQTPEPAPEPARPGSKGRPTRSRKEAEAARRRPLVVDDRKEARRRDRERSRVERAEAQQALMTGDEKKMPLQHRGPERRFVRDVVDSRHNIAEYFFPVALVFMLVALVMPLVRPDLYTLMSTGMIIVLWGGILLCVVDALLLRRRLRRVLTERFGSVGGGLVGYGIMRAIQIRRFRLPRAQIKHGQEPR